MSSPGTDQRVVSDRYALRAFLGRGGMGQVWRADDLLLRRPVAVKEVEIIEALPGDERTQARQRVLREARAAARSTHPGSVAVYDVVDQDDRVYIVMELVDAPGLDEVVTERGPMAPDQAAQLGLRLVAALEAAHDSGVIHRDVKPSNVMVRPDGSVKLADFGIAAVTDDINLTTTGLVRGSPAYMAPEQARGDATTPATDLWSLGATLYYAVEGRPPWDKGGAIPTLTAIVSEDPRPPERAGDLGPLLLALLAKDPAERPGAAEVASRLQEISSGAQGRAAAALAPIGSDEATVAGAAVADATAVAASPVAASPVTAAAADTAAAPRAPAAPARGAPVTPVTSPGGRRRGRWQPWAIAAIVLLAVAAAGVGLTQAGGDDPDPAAAPSTTAAAESDPAVTSSTPSSAPSTTATTAVDEDGASSEVPDGWTVLTDDATGYTIAHPSEWRVQERSGVRTDITDPDSGAYLRVEWTDDPGPSPEGAWEEQEAAFSPSYPDYERIRIDPTTFQGFDAAEWEYTFAGMRAVNLGFVTGDRGFALNFVAPQGRWDDLQDTFESFKASFEAPGGGGDDEDDHDDD